MLSKFKLTGFDALKAALRNVAEKVPETGRKTMHRGADKIEKLAKLQCPHDTGALEDSIHQEVQYEDRGRLAIDIVCGGESDGVNVDDYALEVHENYSHMKPGPGTLAKMAANPGIEIGEKFLTRAVESQSDKLSRDIIEAVILTAKTEIEQ